MSTALSSLANVRLSTAPVPSQRYGLSVVLRKAYPAVGNNEQRTKDREPTCNVRGTVVERATWDDLPGEIVELVRKRVADDSLAAFHVLRAANMHAIHVSGERVINLKHFATPGTATTLLVDVAPHAKVVIQESHESAPIHESTFAEDSGGGGVAYSSVLVLLHVGEGARVQWFGQSVRVPGFAVIERLALLGGDAVLEHHSVLLAANALRENVHVALNAPGATAHVKTLFVGGTDPTSPDGLRGAGHQFDLGITAEHRAPHTVSNLAAKGVLTGKAQAVVRGLVRIEREASGSDGYQRCDTLLLSPTAEVDPIPNLEINTNDVRCTHGVTTGRLNAEQLFYLQSRGFSDAAARDLLVSGFVGGLLRAWPDAQREDLSAAVSEILQESP
ncbi:MAG: SufD family Fe-S cluster assembly protein [bacterium]|nr:SufD family Fe-S cluster assembly protein [bacterium]